MPQEILPKSSQPGPTKAPTIYTVNTKNTKESPALYISHTIKSFAESLIGLFVPIYIFTLKDIPHLTNNPITDAFILILTFYLARSLAALLLMNFLTNTIFGFLNFKKAIFVGNIFLAISMVLLALTPFSIFFLWASTITFAVETTMYWIPYHLFFIRKASTADGHYGHTFGMRILLAQLASAASPLIGGLIITYFGFISLFSIGTVLIIISAIPILFSVHEQHHGKHNAQHIFEKLIRDSTLFNDTIAIAATESDGLLYSIFWPILIFVTAASYTQIGIITSVSVTVSCFAALVIGNLVDKRGAKFIHKIGCTINSILYLPRIFLSSMEAFFMLDIMDKLNGILYGVPFNAIMYQHARERMHDSEFIVYRAIICHITIAIMCLVTVFLLLILPSWKLIFIFMALVAPFAYLINKKPAQKSL